MDGLKIKANPSEYGYFKGLLFSHRRV